jgi:hypothetical protein
MPDARRPYVRPEVVRVDLIEDEVALQVCKTAAPQTTVKGTAPGGCRAKICNQNGTS